MGLGTAIKQRVLKLYDAGDKTAVIAKRLCVSPAYVRRVKQRRGEPPRKITGRPPKLDEVARLKLAAWVAERPDATLEELRARCQSESNTSISIGALWATLRAMKLTLKKKSVIASEQTRADVVAARESFFAEQLKDVPLQDVVVLDESYATTTFTRLRGRCPRNRRLKESVPAGHWKTLTILGAITVAGVLAAATVNAATDGEVFGAFVRECLVPSLGPGMVVVMDNLSAHKVSGIREAIEAAGCRLVYLPPYSPDLSPIENIWSKAKNVLRLLAARTTEQLALAIAEALEQITPHDCRGCFDACGYSLHLK